jgi:Transcriptional regulator, AbiEi antitoxin
MHPAIAGIMATQHGLVTRRQAIAAGLAAEYVDRLARTGAWVTVRRGVYAETELWESLTRPEDKQLIRDRAASLRISRPHVMSHSSAALELGMDVLRATDQVTHVTRPGIVGSHLRHGVKHHLAPYRPDQVIEINGRRVLDPARTAADIAREHGLQAGVVAFDSALRLGCSDREAHRLVRPAHRLGVWLQARHVTDRLGRLLGRAARGGARPDGPRVRRHRLPLRRVARRPGAIHCAQVTPPRLLTEPHAAVGGQRSGIG